MYLPIIPEDLSSFQDYEALGQPLTALKALTQLLVSSDEDTKKGLEALLEVIVDCFEARLWILDAAFIHGENLSRANAPDELWAKLRHIAETKGEIRLGESAPIFGSTEPWVARHSESGKEGGASNG